MMYGCVPDFSGKDADVIAYIKERIADGSGAAVVLHTTGRRYGTVLLKHPGNAWVLRTSGHGFAHSSFGIVANVRPAQYWEAPGYVVVETEQNGLISGRAEFRPSDVESIGRDLDRTMTRAVDA